YTLVGLDAFRSVHEGTSLMPPWTTLDPSGHAARTACGVPPTRTHRMVLSAASATSAVTASGTATGLACELRISTTCARARLAMNCCAARGITLSSVPIRAKDGMVFHAGVPDA